MDGCGVLIASPLLPILYIQASERIFLQSLRAWTPMMSRQLCMKPIQPYSVLYSPSTLLWYLGALEFAKPIRRVLRLVDQKCENQNRGPARRVASLGGQPANGFCQ